MNTQARFRLGTRGSPLALKQAEAVKARLVEACDDLNAAAVEIVAIRTSGDKFRRHRLSEIGGKGLFTKEIEEALIRGDIDVAVHSMKDMPTDLPEGLMLASVPERDDPRDALICEDAAALAELPAGAVVGTASLRRQAQVLHACPHLKVELLRGNVGTRMEKVRSGDYAATLLALCGLQRLGYESAARAVLDPEIYIPAVGQGALALECRADDAALHERLSLIDHEDSHVAMRAERAFLAALDGSCRTPIAGLARTGPDGEVDFHGAIYAPDGSDMYATRRRGPAAKAAALGRDAGEALRREAGETFFAMLHEAAG